VTNDLRIVLRSPGADDISYVRTAHGARFAIESAPATGDALVSTDAANRLLTLWGRCSLGRDLSVDTDSMAADTVNAILWPSAVPWTRH
jgi:hypothetical protein